MNTIADLRAVLERQRTFCVLNDDCANAMRVFQNGQVDVTMTDPPYDAKTHVGARSSAGKGNGSKVLEIDFAPLSTYEFVDEALTVTRAWVLCFCAGEQLGEYKTAAGDKRYIRGCAWDRPDGSPQFTGDRPAQWGDCIALMHREGKKIWNGGGKRGSWSCGVERNERVHPTQKPLKLMMQLVEDFTQPGDLIFDPFCGSGTTGVAAVRLGRRFIGVELKKEYAQIAFERVSAETNGLDLSAARAGQLPMFGEK